MKLKAQKIPKFYLKSILCITLGTLLGIIVYIIFLRLNIAIFGWNLGLIFAPLTAGYIETILANKIIGKNLGAISAFILFLDTTIYSFIIKNTSLGFNFITIGSIFVILQAAFPTLINHILIIFFSGILSRIVKKSKSIIKTLKYYYKRPSRHLEPPVVNMKTKTVSYFDEVKSNERINNQNFYFLTNTDLNEKTHKHMGIYQSEIILEKTKHEEIEPEINEKRNLMMIKEGKDECLIKLAEQIKNNGGNGILDLTMHYNLIGIGKDNLRITAIGMGIYIYE